MADTPPTAPPGSPDRGPGMAGAGAPAQPRVFRMLDLPPDLQAHIMRPLYTRWLWGSRSPEHARLRDRIFRSDAQFAHLEEALLPPHPILRADASLWPGEAFCEAARRAQSWKVLFWARANGCRWPAGLRDTLTALALPDGVTRLSEHAFQNCVRLTSISLPDGLVCIERHALSGCIRLRSIRLPDGLVDIGPSAFAGCVRLSSITLPEGLIRLGGGGDGQRAELGAFQHCTALTSVAFPASLQQLGVSAFSMCRLLQRAHLRHTAVRSVPDFAFFQCLNLEEVTFPRGGLERIGSYAFSRCALRSVRVAPGPVKLLRELGVAAFAGCRSLESVELPEGLTHLGVNRGRLHALAASTGAFESCPALTRLRLPASLTELGPRPFKQCRALRVLLLHHTRVTSLPDSAFAECGRLDIVTLPPALTRIGEFCFMDCGSLREVPLPAMLNSLGKGAFAVCLSLARVDLRHTKVEELEDETFATCRALASVQLPARLKRIGAFVFEECAALQQIELPDALRELGNEAFSGCVRLTRVSLPGGLLQIGEGVWNDCDQLREVVVRSRMRWDVSRAVSDQLPEEAALLLPWG